MNLSDFILRYRQGEGEWQIFNLLSENILVGRGEDNDLVLDHREVSRHHFRIRFQDDTLQIIDLESSNGTRLDGISLVPQIPSPIRPGQIIEVGDFSLLMEKSEEGSTHISREMLPYLIRYRFGPGTWQTFPLEPGEKTLGRDPNSDFHLNDIEVSRKHALVRIDDDGIWLTDLESTNGTKIDGVELVPYEESQLQLGQIFSMGNFILQIDEPSRFYQAPSAVSGKPGSDEILAPVVSAESAQTVFEADAAISPSPPLQAVNLISRSKVRIGADANNDVVLRHPMVNRHHAVIERMGNRFRIQDLRSANGIFVNGKRIARAAFLKDWDKIQIGPFAFVLSGDDLQQQVVSGLKLEAQNISQQVSDSFDLLQDVNLSVGPNELVALVGMDKSGEAALLNALTGYRPASHGSVQINGVDLYEHYDLFRSDIGYLPQGCIVHQELTPKAALNYVAQLRLPSDISRQERNTVVSEVLSDLDLIEVRNISISRLSVGQIKRVSMGCELLTKPRFFYLDDPAIGLDPGAEYEMMKLLRRFVKQGRTIIFSTRATKNLMLCDKVICLARGGNLAFFGAPEDALHYFDPYRTDPERYEKEMGFDDVYRVLNDSARGTPVEWRERYLSSHVYQLTFGIEPRLAEAEPLPAHLPVPKAAPLQPSSERVSGLRQFFVLSLRNLKILAQDRVSLTLMLGLAPLLGLLDVVWGPNLYDPAIGDARKIILLWFIGALVTLLVGALSSMRKISKEKDIYKHERAVNLKIMPYVFSKLWLGVVLAFYQAGVLLIFRYLFVNPTLPSPSALLALYVTFFLGIITGYMIGLLISAIAPNPSLAIGMISGILFLQILFSGVLIPLDWIPGGSQISSLMPTRWEFESFMRITGLGEELAGDPCWTGYDKDVRYQLSTGVKEGCSCMGASIFTDCADFPGILSLDFYDQASQISLRAAEPDKPSQPTAYGYPTAIPSPTLLPTPTLLPSLTPYPTPQNSDGFPKYINDMLNQGAESQRLVSDQFEKYHFDIFLQRDAYLQALTAQGEAYTKLRDAQSDEFVDAMQTYGDAHAAWQENRANAIYSAEALLGSFYDNYHQVFQGSLLGRWVILMMMQLGLFILIILAQKRKDKV